MLHLKIRVPYKAEKTEEIVKKIESSLSNIDPDMCSIIFGDYEISINLDAEEKYDTTLNLRLLDVE